MAAMLLCVLSVHGQDGGVLTTTDSPAPSPVPPLVPAAQTALRGAAVQPSDVPVWPTGVAPPPNGVSIGCSKIKKDLRRGKKLIPMLR